GPLFDQPAHRLHQRDVGAGDRGRPRAAVRLDHVAVDLESAFPEDVEICDRPQRASDQALDLVRPAADPPLDRLPWRAGVGGPRQHRVLGRDPAAGCAPEKWRLAVLDAYRAEDPGLT